MSVDKYPSIKLVSDPETECPSLGLRRAVDVFTTRCIVRWGDISKPQNLESNSTAIPAELIATPQIQVCILGNTGIKERPNCQEMEECLKAGNKSEINNAEPPPPNSKKRIQ